MKPNERESISGAVSRAGINLSVTANDRIFSVHLSDPSSEVADELVQSFVLGFCGQIAIEIAHETDADGNIVQIVAVNVASTELAIPPISNFDLAVSRRCTVSDHEMVGQSIGHSADMTMVVIEDAGVTLARPAVVNDNIFPAITADARVINCSSDRGRQVLPMHAVPAALGLYEVLLLFRSGFLNNDRISIVMFAEKEPMMLLFRSCRGCLHSGGRR